ncbi:hypothetical protein [Methylogaea oryzae]|uniref:hypothetical protein n=1 Tax=Methylogaea oryzae TaxID=1295382 RepID=UPI0006CF2227|nr:hypothetical protein [Methylogaea oryzae]
MAGGALGLRHFAIELRQGFAATSLAAHGPQAIDSFRPILFLLVDIQQLGGGGLPLRGHRQQAGEDLLGAVEQAGAQIIHSQLETDAAPLAFLQTAFRQQRLMQSDGPLYLAWPSLRARAANAIWALKESPVVSSTPEISSAALSGLSRSK